MMGILDRIKQDANAVRILADWVGKGREPVDRNLAQARANVCRECPHNKPGRKLESSVASAILEQDGLRSQVGAPLDGEGHLRSCELCGCYLKLKVWVPMKHLRPRTRIRDFPAHCWMQTENQKQVQPAVISTSADEVQVVVRRMNAMGDAIMASGMCSMLHDMGMTVGFQTAPGLREIFRNHPHFKLVDHAGSRLIDLDGAWERLPNRASVNRRDEYVRVAVNQAKQLGIPLKPEALPNATLSVTEGEVSHAGIETLLYRRPLIGIVPGSDKFANRNIGDGVWLEFQENLRAAGVLWLGKRQPPDGIKHVQIQGLRHLMALISVCDLVVSADTGPMHMAIALGVQTLAVQGPFFGHSMLPKESRWAVTGAPISCLGCGDFECKLEGDRKNACTRPDPKALAELAEKLL